MIPPLGKIVLQAKVLCVFDSIEAVGQRCSLKKVFLEISENSRENTCARPQSCNFIKKETLAQVFSCEFWEIFKNIFYCRTPPVTASDNRKYDSTAAKNSFYRKNYVFPLVRSLPLKNIFTLLCYNLLKFLQTKLCFC